jgi:predicted nucleic acid-binding protein
MQTVVADSSVFIHLSSIQRALLLRDLFNEVRIPPAVWTEVVEQGKTRPGELELCQAVVERWIKIEAPPAALVPGTGVLLHKGEAEAIGLARNVPNPLLIIDEAYAREIAKGFGVKIIGIVGLLVMAKQQGLIPTLADELQRLRNPGGFRISNQLYQEALLLGGEKA